MQTLRSQIEDEPNPTVPTWECKTQELHDVVSRYLPQFYGRAYRYLRNAHDAEDAVQDALLAAYTHLDQFKGNARMTTWLTTIVTNSALTHLRRRPHQPHSSLDDRLAQDQSGCLSDVLADVRPSPEDEYATSQLQQHLMQFVAELSPLYREAIQLRDLDDLSTAETASILGVAESTVKTRVSRARSQLKQRAKRGRKRLSMSVGMETTSSLHVARN